ncbi:two-component system sensor histidine kinase CreC [Catenovulum sp. SX2]|uniref:two-component system sensor histidine kinase CreC n=1 Tax=Catenovulum sp. SX2 TaxID=3398614 RepID=UPI003F83E1F5
MSLNFRIFSAYFVVLALAIYLLFNAFMSEIKPGYRQSTEEALVDMANLVAELITEDFIGNNQHSISPNIQDSIRRLGQRAYQADIFNTQKSYSKLRIYITDKQGIVRYDSSGKDIGADYSQWNDVYLTLRGQYGARSTKADPNDDLSSVMHVAAPIYHQQQIIGVVTVAKPNIAVQPFIDKVRAKLKNQGIWLIVISFVLALALAYGLTHSIRKLVNYANNVAQGKRLSPPKLAEKELSKLADAMENMRQQLEGKEYVEQYIHTLTHELKSPISAIKGASEIISADMQSADLTRFIQNIQSETNRINHLVNKLLELASLEKQQSLTQLSKINLNQLLDKVVESKQYALESKSISIQTTYSQPTEIQADKLLISQAVDNLLQNAIDFSPEQSRIKLRLSHINDKQISIQVEDQGSGIPHYALDKIFNRFYSLPRPATGQKSSGLGLCFVQQIAELHQGKFVINNTQNQGVSAKLILPTQQN